MRIRRLIRELRAIEAEHGNLKIMLRTATPDSTPADHASARLDPNNDEPYILITDRIG
ncbi:hypothetical protein [Sphingomonas sp. ACRSK]|uniref:hypothetical protein n=1 Tax=Sphingomonas sp. ACRSK TaxID=2918213 RepID=UPI001EF3FB80|nr:hypothetical protein [Sphingomonas sp. ACRSK]MCG7348827.1 hypothetical protein [Sphingomonas sp. ACRSK]